MNRDLRDYLCGLTLIEDAYNPYKPEYLKMDEEHEAERVCMRCEDKYYRKSCEDYCDSVIECLEERQKLLSSANRVIDALVKRGYCGLSMYLKDRVEQQSDGQIEFEWGTSETEEFCRRCRLYGKPKCPEDVNDETCYRHGVVGAIEHVVSAVNDLL